MSFLGIAPAQICTKNKSLMALLGFLTYAILDRRILNTKITTCPRYVIYNVNTDASGNVFLNTSKDGHQILGAFPLYGNISITAVGYYNGAYYAFCNDFDGSSCANRPVTIGVLYID